MSQFTSAGGGGVPVVATIQGKVNLTAYNVPMALASTEYSFTVPANARSYYLKLRDKGVPLQYAFAPGTSGTTYVTLPANNWYGEENLTDPTVTIYFQANVATQVVEIIVAS